MVPHNWVVSQTKIGVGSFYVLVLRNVSFQGLVIILSPVVEDMVLDVVVPRLDSQVVEDMVRDVVVLRLDRLSGSTEV